VLAQVLDIVRDQNSDLNERLSYIRILGEERYPDAIPMLIDILKRPALQESKAVKITILNTLQRYDRDLIAEEVLKVYPGILREDPDVRLNALNLLVSRSDWVKALINNLEEKSINH